MKSSIIFSWWTFIERLGNKRHIDVEWMI